MAMTELDPSTLEMIQAAVSQSDGGAGTPAPQSQSPTPFDVGSLLQQIMGTQPEAKQAAPVPPMDYPPNTGAAPSSDASLMPTASPADSASPVGGMPPISSLPSMPSTVAGPTSGQIHMPGQIPGGQPPQQGIGGVVGLFMDLLKPGRNVPFGQPVPSKMDRFESFLGNFLQSLSAGYSQEGHGPGSFGRGMGAAMQAPYQNALQQYQLQQAQQAQQAQIDIEKAKTAAMTPNIPMSDPSTGKTVMVAPSDMGKLLAAGYRLQGARETAAAGVQKAQIGADAKETVARYKVIPGVGLYDTQDGQLINGTAKGILVTQDIANQFGLPKDFIDKPLSISEFSALKNGQVRYAGTTRQTSTHNADGTVSWASSSTRPNIPAQGISLVAPGAGGGAPTGGGGNVASKIANLKSGNGPNASSADVITRMESSINPLDSTAIALVEGNRDPSQLSKRGAALEQTMQRAKAYSMAKYGVPYNAAQAQEDYKYASGSQNQNTLKMINGMTEDGGAIQIAQNAFNAIPGKIPSQTINSILDGTTSEFGGKSVVGFRTAMLGLADEYSKVMGGGVGSDTGRQQALDIIKESYSKGQGAEAVNIMQKDIAARKKAIIGDNQYLKRQYGVSVIQTSDGQTLELPTKNLFTAKQRDPKLKVIGEK